MIGILMEDDDHNIYLSEVSKPDLCKIHGKCIVFNKNEQTLYEGWFNNDIRSGKGRLIDNYSRTYEGEWNDGLFHGYGIYSWPDGRKYIG